MDVNRQGAPAPRCSTLSILDQCQKLFFTFVTYAGFLYEVQTISRESGLDIIWRRLSASDAVSFTGGAPYIRFRPGWLLSRSRITLRSCNRIIQWSLAVPWICVNLVISPVWDVQCRLFVNYSSFSRSEVCLPPVLHKPHDRNIINMATRSLGILWTIACLIHTWGQLNIRRTLY